MAKPSGPGLFPGVVLVHHLPGWSEFYIETTRRFAYHGYLAICANLYERAGQGDPDDVAAKVRADGGIPDAQVVGDTDAAVKWMRTQTNHNGKIGVFGSCSGGGGELGHRALCIDLRSSRDPDSICHTDYSESSRPKHETFPRPAEHPTT